MDKEKDRIDEKNYWRYFIDNRIKNEFDKNSYRRFTFTA